MRIIIDLQGAQNDSRGRGIGRYSLSLALALARQRREHEIIVLLSSAFPDTISPLKARFADLLKDDAFIVFEPLAKIRSCDPENSWRRNASEMLYEHIIDIKQADALIVCSLFEGWGDDTVTSIHKLSTKAIVAPILHDLIPLQEMADAPDTWPSDRRTWYFRKLNDLRCADLLLANSESSKAEAMRFLDLDAKRIFNVSAAAAEVFTPWICADREAARLLSAFGIDRPYVLSAAKIEPRKNPHGLIHAYARLPENVRREHQLVFVGEVENEQRLQLLEIAEQVGLSREVIVFTGRVDDAALAKLYSRCKAFIFPSFHEGFGLPALEAMACGAPTIASNTTSLPEVVGLEDALFDPHDVADIAHCLMRVLCDANFRTHLIQHGLQRSLGFSWERSAGLVLDALEAALEGRPTSMSVLRASGERPRLAFVSPMPSGAQADIATKRAAQMLAVLAPLYAVDVIAEDGVAPDPSMGLGGANLQSASWFLRNGHLFDRIIYYIADSSAHGYVLRLLDCYSGLVILHDFFLEQALRSVDATAPRAGAWSHAVQRSHGWQALLQSVAAGPERAPRFPANWNVLQRAEGIIVHSSAAAHLMEFWYGCVPEGIWREIALPTVPSVCKREQAREDLGLRVEDFAVSAFGQEHDLSWVAPLLDAWRAVAAEHRGSCRLTIVTPPPTGEHATGLRARLSDRSLRSTVRFVSDPCTQADRAQFIVAADVVLELGMTPSGRASDVILQSIGAGVPAVCDQAVGVASEHEAELLRVNDPCDASALAAALRAARGIAVHLSTGVSQPSPDSLAHRYADAIEKQCAAALHRRLRLLQGVATLEAPSLSSDVAALAEALVRITPPIANSVCEIFVDISELAQRDARTGVQRVTRNVLRNLFLSTPKGYRIEPVYATAEHGYRYARRFTANFLGASAIEGMRDEPIVGRRGDIFWGLDLQAHVVPQHRDAINRMRIAGVKVVFTLHDLLPITLPQTYGHPGEAHARWLDTLARVADGIIAVSRHSMLEAKRWLELFGPITTNDLKLAWVHNGADLEEDERKSSPPHAIRQDLGGMFSAPAFLMVGTVEPRKAHSQVLAAFEILWSRGIRANLIIVGKEGWRMEVLAARLREHALRESCLFWRHGVDDATLEAIYSQSACLIAASLDEGFGLPLVEAARHGLPILARDIPVFREVAGEHAEYFRGHAPHELARAIEDWLAQAKEGLTMLSKNMPWLTWKQSTAAMLDVILNDRWIDTCAATKDPHLVARFWGSDYRLGSNVGERFDTTVQTTGRAGYLLFGPYIGLAPGNYIAIIRGTVGFGGAGRILFDIVANGARDVLAETPFAADQSRNDILDVEITFQVTSPTKDLEIRIEVDEQSDICIEMLEILRAVNRPKPNVSRINIPTPQIYSTAPERRRFWATHTRMGSDVGYITGRSVSTIGRAGIVLFGPHIDLTAGKHIIRIYGEPTTRHGDYGLEVEVAKDDGRCILARLCPIRTDGYDTTIISEFFFELAEFTPRIEIRVRASRESSVTLHGIEFTR